MDNRLRVKNSVVIKNTSVAKLPSDPSVNLPSDPSVNLPSVYAVWTVPEKRSASAVKVLSAFTDSGNVTTKVYSNMKDLVKDQPILSCRKEENLWISMYDHGRSYISNGKWAWIMAKIDLSETQDFTLNITYLSYHDDGHKWVMPTAVFDSDLLGNLSLNLIVRGFPKLNVKYRDKRDIRWTSNTYTDGITQLSVSDIQKIQTRNVVFDAGEYASSSEDEELTDLLHTFGFTEPLSSDYERPNVISVLKS